MRTEILKEKFESLSNSDRKEVLDFIDFLRSKKKRLRKRLKSSILNIEDEKFVGMWKNRNDMKDSTAWVRNLRNSDWVN